MLADKILREIVPDPEKLTLEINSLGSSAVKQQYNQVLKEYFTKPQIWDSLSEQSQMRVENGNPLRVLDSKNPTDQEISASAPRINDTYDTESEQKFTTVLSSLDSLSIPYKVTPSLCRGLDYYTHTCFEFKYSDSALGRSQNTILAGGRYDGLALYLGHTSEISSVGKSQYKI